MKLKFIDGDSAAIEGLTPDSIGAASYSAFENLSSRTTGVETQLAQAQSDISGTTAFAYYVNSRIDNLVPSSVGLSNVAQNSNSEILLNSNTFVDGQLTAFAKLETRLSQHGLNIQPWAESNCWSARFDIWSENDDIEHEFSFFRNTFGMTGKSGIAIYRPDGTDSVNHYLAAYGSTYFCFNGGYFGIGTNNPQDLLHVSGSIRCEQSIKLGGNENSISYADNAPTSGTWKRGDRIYNSNPSANGFIGWVCVSAGIPGTWKTWGAISA